VEGVALGIDERFHADVVEGVRFEEVDYVEAILDIFAGVGYREEVPLGVSVSIVICRQH